MKRIQWLFGICLFLLLTSLQIQVFAEEEIIEEPEVVETQSNQLETTIETSLQEQEEQIPQVQEEVVIQVQEEPTLQVQELYTGWNNNQSQYFQNGKPLNGVHKIGNDYFYFKDYKVQSSFIGFVKNADNKWVFVRNGKSDWSFTGVAKSVENGKWYHGKNGNLDWGFTGFSKSVENGRWYFSKKGALDWSFTGVAQSIENGKWYFSRKGALDWNFTGVAKSIANGQWYHCKKGSLDWGFTGFSKSIENGKWYMSRKGKLDWSFTGVAKSIENGKWYFARKGALDWKYTGGAQSVENGKWYAVRNGRLTWDFTGQLKCTDGQVRSFVKSAVVQTQKWSGSVLTAAMGVNQGPSGKETYYNLPMDGVISIMRSIGNNDKYWIRSDGVKMLGNYVMVAADLSIRPRGSLIETSLGTGIVCDTGSFIYSNSTQLDIAVDW